tara:strand:- start:261 stop:500 length:240 start_codon:yes stop_codon:yes gene_type:complete
MENKNNNGFLGILNDIIDEAFSKVFTDKQEESSQADPKYATIQEYTDQTGKRFRMNKDQKERGLTREEAFTELYLNEEK